MESQKFLSYLGSVKNFVFSPRDYSLVFDFNFKTKTENQKSNARKSKIIEINFITFLELLEHGASLPKARKNTQNNY